MSVFRRVRWIYKKLHLRRLKYSLPFLILTVYTIFGAYIFRYFELVPDEMRRARYSASTEYAFNQVLNRIMKVCCKNKLLRKEQQQQAKNTKDALLWLIDYLNLTQIIKERSDSSPWTWPGSMFYAGQLYTTIGYGLPVAQTPEGRLASIMYIMFGIPIFLLILAQVGKLLSRALRKFYKRIKTAKDKLPEEVTRKMSVKAIYSLTPSILSNSENNCVKTNPKQKTQQKSDIKKNKIIKFANENEIIEQKNEKLMQKKNTYSFPIPLALTILIVWIAFSAAMFCLWETEWGYLTSVYFFFVSISTVGLGDIVPTKPDMMFINFMLILIGLALLSMCINLIQDALERLIEQLIKEYIDEIEKIASVVINNEEFNEEETTQFEVGMSAEMLKLPLTSITKKLNDKKNENNGWRFVKDWMAEQVVSKLLTNRFDLNSSSFSDSDNSDTSDNESNTVVVSTQDRILHHAKASTVNQSELIDGIEVPKIDVHEGTLIFQLNNEQKSLLNDTAPFNSKYQQNKKKQLSTLHDAVPFNNFNKSTIRAIQAIEAAKTKTFQNEDFKSRLFAKFGTNKRLAHLVDNYVALTINQQKKSLPTIKKNKMVTSECQTSPLQPFQRQKILRPAYAGSNFALGSMDSMSSDTPFTNGNNDWTSVCDMDSLYSAGYYDLSFGEYSTDSVPKLISETNVSHKTLNTLNNNNQRNPICTTTIKSTENDNSVINKNVNSNNCSISKQQAAAYQQGFTSMSSSPPIRHQNFYLTSNSSLNNQSKNLSNDFKIKCETSMNSQNNDINQKANKVEQQNKLLLKSCRTPPVSITPKSTPPPIKKNYLRVSNANIVN